MRFSVNVAQAGCVLLLWLFAASPVRADCNHPATSFGGGAEGLLSDPLTLLAQWEEDSSRPSGDPTVPDCFHCGTGAQGLPAPVQIQTPPNDGLAPQAVSRQPRPWRFLSTPLDGSYSLELADIPVPPPRSV